MTNRDDHFSAEMDNLMFNLRTNNDQLTDSEKEFTVSHSDNIIEKLIHLSRFGNLLTLVVGNAGCGKSYLLNNFLNSVDDDYQICHIKGQPLLSIDQLFQNIIESFAGESTFTGIPLTAKQYEDWADQLATVPGNRLVVIDDAEVLSTSVLHELCQLSAMQQAKETPHLHLILFGNYDLNNVLEQAAQGVLDEDGIYAIDVPALSKEESKNWLNYLFTQSGVVFHPDEDELDAMLTKGQGNLSLLKDIAKDYSSTTHEIETPDEEPKKWRVSMIGYWFSALTVLIFLILGSFMYQDEIFDLMGMNDKQREKVTSAQTVKNPDDLQTVKGTTAIDQNDLAQDSTSQNFEETSSAETLPDNSTTQTDLAFDPPSSVEDDFESEEVNQSEEKILSEAVPSTDDSGTVLNQDEELSDGSTSDVIAKNEENSEIIADEVVANNLESSISEIQPEFDDSRKSLPETPLQNYTEEEQLLMAEPDEHYAVQLIGLSKEDAIIAFLAKHNLANAVYYRSVLNNSPWYIAVLAGYANKNQALRARAELSKELRDNGAWVKSMGVIKREISKASIE